MTHGSFMAVMNDGKHVTAFGVFATSVQFREWVRQMLTDKTYGIRRFYYAWGFQCQEYTAAEVREVFFDC